MKKLRANSKRKWIVGGVMFFGGIALITTGFATWVIGSQITKNEGSVDVTVQSAINESITLNIAQGSDSKLVLADTVVDGSSFVHNNDAGSADLQFNLGAISIECGKEYFETNYEGKEVSLTLALDSNIAVDTQTNVVGKNSVAKSGIKFDAAGSSRKASETYTYVELKTTEIVLSSNEQSKLTTDSGIWTEKNGVYKLNIDAGKTVDLQWGTFFRYQEEATVLTPAEFYNKCLGVKPSLKTVTEFQNIAAELNAMHDAFMGASGSAIAKPFFGFTATIAVAGE